jgi:hypothetical protein
VSTVPSHHKSPHSRIPLTSLHGRKSSPVVPFAEHPRPVEPDGGRTTMITAPVHGSADFAQPILSPCPMAFFTTSHPEIQRIFHRQQTSR